MGRNSPKSDFNNEVKLLAEIVRALTIENYDLKMTINNLQSVNNNPHPCKAVKHENIRENVDYRD